MGEASERAAEAGWIAQCLIAGIAHQRDRTPGITYVAVPSGQRGELREFGVEQIMLGHSPDGHSQLVIISFAARAFGPGQRDEAEAAARSILGRLEHGGEAAAGNRVSITLTYHA